MNRTGLLASSSEFGGSMVEGTIIGHMITSEDQLLSQFIDQSEYLSSLIDDLRIYEVASALLGLDYNYESSDGNYYVGDTG